MQKFRSILDLIPHWVFVGLMMSLGAIVQNLQQQPDFFSALASWTTAWPMIRNALLFGAASFIGYLKTDPWSAAKMRASKVATLPPPPRTPRIPPGAAATLLLIAFVLSTAPGCTKATVPLPPNTPADVTQAVDCILADVFAGQTDIYQIAKCVDGDIALAADIVEWLLQFATVREKLRPENIAVLMLNSRSAKARNPRPDTTLWHPPKWSPRTGFYGQVCRNQVL